MSAVEGPPELAHEVWVVGQPNPGDQGIEFPPYRVQWTDASAQRHGYGDTALEGARAFCSNPRMTEWTEPPRVQVRQKLVFPWVLEETS